MPATLVLVRHGESEWNKANIFTGWVDVELSDAGREEAARAGELLKEADIKFDVAYTSVLKRAIKTCWACLEGTDQMWIPVVRSWRLNERMYGGLQGLNKTQTVEKHGMDQVMVWRRSYDTPPPPIDESSEYWPGNDPKYANVDKKDLPKSECLKDTVDRFMPLWETEIAPLLKQGKTVLIAAHGNSLRALVKHLDSIDTESIAGLNIPTAIPLVYKLDDDLKPIAQPGAVAPLSGAYLGDAAAAAEAAAKVANQVKQ